MQGKPFESELEFLADACQGDPLVQTAVLSFPEGNALKVSLLCMLCCAVLSCCAAWAQRAINSRRARFACCAVFSCSPAVLSFPDGFPGLTLSLLCVLDILLRYCCGNISHGHPSQSQPALHVGVCYRKVQFAGREQH